MSSCFPRDTAWQSTYVHVNTNGIQHLGLSDVSKSLPVVLPLLSSKLVTLEIAVKIHNLQIMLKRYVFLFVFSTALPPALMHFACLLISVCDIYEVYRGVPEYTDRSQSQSQCE